MNSQQRTGAKAAGKLWGLVVLGLILGLAAALGVLLAAGQSSTSSEKRTGSNHQVIISAPGNTETEQESATVMPRPTPSDPVTAGILNYINVHESVPDWVILSFFPKEDPTD